MLVLTKNEENDLSDCLESCCFSNDIVVYDSNSTDKTREIALKYSARFTTRPNQDFSQPFGGDESLHRNWGIHEIVYKNDFVFILDADERISPELRACLIRGNYLNTSFDAFKIKRYDYLAGRHLKHVQASAWYTRLIIPSKCNYTRLINPVLEVCSGNIGSLDGHIIHYPFSKGMSHWISKHNSYSSLEALEFQDKRRPLSLSLLRSALFSRNFHTRRHCQKDIYYNLPMRPLLKFLILYFFKLGFLDGSPGFKYALLQSIYEYFICLKSSSKIY